MLLALVARYCCLRSRGRQHLSTAIRDGGLRYTASVASFAAGEGEEMYRTAALVAVMGELRFMGTWGWVMRAFLAYFLKVGYFHIGTGESRGVGSKILRWM
jgi:hypothetical protein